MCSRWTPARGCAGAPSPWRCWTRAQALGKLDRQTVQPNEVSCVASSSSIFYLAKHLEEQFGSFFIPFRVLLTKTCWRCSSCSCSSLLLITLPTCEVDFLTAWIQWLKEMDRRTGLWWNTSFFLKRMSFFSAGDPTSSFLCQCLRLNSFCEAFVDVQLCFSLLGEESNVLRAVTGHFTWLSPN
jgi:hypothetical protein